MDRIIVNINYDNVKIGDEVLLLGNEKEINIWKWCRLLDTIPYEVICGISPRVPRVYK